ncbi:DinB family protein [Hymenobacter guriensis]|uniref:DinB family protein n=1 Tax=Hymenobacter guriensis TaxID=2793065 RepID=A0ABS0L1V3_9BACT|nr:DinB family protein [Hymenobacter guriensis]MBG8554090.1 DinB family protein [Hymenobacter guriensis]
MTKRKFRISFGNAQDHSVDYLIGILEDARITTIQSINNLSVEELDWQYKAGWNTIGALLAHIIAVEHYFRIEFIGGRKLTEEENAKWLPALDLGPYVPQLITGELIDSYIDRLTESRRQLVEVLKTVSFEEFTKRIEDYDPETGCDLAWALYHMVEDEIYHRGQISIIRKLYKEQLAINNYSQA